MNHNRFEQEQQRKLGLRVGLCLHLHDMMQFAIWGRIRFS
jgi:hypothetical protein